MRQTPGGSTAGGDTALRTPSWRPEVEGGSQDVRAIIPSLSPAPVSLGLSWWLFGDRVTPGDTRHGNCRGPGEQQRGVMGTLPLVPAAGLGFAKCPLQPQSPPGDDSPLTGNV